jgi:hypothetical protein
MILGMSVPVFTAFHVAISLIGLLSGAIVLLGMLTDRRLPGWAALFLVTTIATSATGFLFHSASFGPPHIVGVISLVVLAAAVAGLYIYHLSGAWRPRGTVGPAGACRARRGSQPEEISSDAGRGNMI